MNEEQGEDIISVNLPFDGVQTRAPGDKIGIQPIGLLTELVSAGIIREDFEGALLKICRIKDGRIYPHGTGFMVMPGLALTAAHVIYSSEDLELGDVQVRAFAFQRSRLLDWVVTGIIPSGDVALLELKPHFDLGPSFLLKYFQMTVRAPLPGETVICLGQIAEQESYDLADDPVDLAFTRLAAVGMAIEQLPIAPLNPGPTTHCRFMAPSGMSGGPVFSKGLVCGLLSSSMEGSVEGEPFDAFVASLVPVLTREFQPAWPPGYYKQPISIWPSYVRDADHFEITPLKDDYFQYNYYPYGPAGAATK